MRLLFVSVPAQGHVRPLLGLALAARAAGHEVDWVSGPDVSALLGAHGWENTPVGVSMLAALDGFRRAYPGLAQQPGREQAALAFPRLFGDGLAFPMLAGLEAVVARRRPDLIVHEPAALAAPLVARSCGVPHVVHAFGLPIPASLLHLAAQAMTPAWERAGLFVPADAGVYGSGSIEITPPTLRALAAAPESAPFVLTQRPASVTALPGECLPAPLVRMLEASRGRPLVAVTFGTLHRGGPVWTQLLRALEDLPAQCVVTTGPLVSPLPPEALPPHVFMAAYLPHEALLPHCQLLVSHAGAGSALAALSLGLPQVCLPQGADQFRNADVLAACGAAHVLDAGVLDAPPDAAAIHALILEALADASLAGCAARLRDEIECMPLPRDNVGRLESLTSMDGLGAP
jgi:UDP:flavonoid glycosyltransferase YjiC (YdhE family)